MQILNIVFEQENPATQELPETLEKVTKPVIFSILTSPVDKHGIDTGLFQDLLALQLFF